MLPAFESPAPIVEHDLGAELGRLRELVSEAMAGETHVLEYAEQMATLVRAVTGLAAHQLKAEQTISAKELRSLVSSMGNVVNEYVDDNIIRAKIQRGWLALIGSVVK